MKVNKTELNQRLKECNMVFTSTSPNTTADAPGESKGYIQVTKKAAKEWVDTFDPETLFNISQTTPIAGKSMLWIG